MDTIPLVDLREQFRRIEPEIRSAIDAVLERADFIQGEDVKAFEKEFAASQKAKNCIGVANGTDAIFIALKALGIGPGDIVVTAANSFIASSEAITMAGARPAFIDCDPATFNLDPVRLARFLESEKGKGVKAIVVVHLYGRAADMDALLAVTRKFGLRVIEDCAQAHGATWGGKPVGTFGDAATFSFYPGKNLGAYGDAGAILSGDDRLAARMRMFANHGRMSKYDHEFEGVNSRLDSLQAAVLRVKLRHLPAWTRKRIENAVLYRECLSGVRDLALPDFQADGSHVFHLFVVRTPRRDELQKKLSEKGISTTVHYPVALPNLMAYRHLGYGPMDFPVATRNEKEVLSLPMYPELGQEQIRLVANSVRAVLGE